ncbi:MAG: retroviral-like aspartic protease family protein [Armatimonadota bacterium]|nr:retroviral-like aspartic protease family protein [Armatimonadota bacterium]
MSFAFDPALPLVILQAELQGPSANGFVRLVLDTGATDTIINEEIILSLGYDPTLAPERFEITMGSGIGLVTVVSVDRIVALGQEHTNFPVLCHTLPPSVEVDGVLGLDFLRGHVLTVDFINGEITLN